MAKPILKIEDLEKSLGGNKILKGISLDVYEGDVLVIIGPSGTGKSTLLRCINHLIFPDSGKIYLKDTEIDSKKTNLCKVRQRIGMVFQDFNLFNHLTALQNVAIGLIKVKKMDKKKAYKIAEKELERVGLKERAAHYPAELSGGQKQRVAIARAVAMEPEIMLFDEPTSALDPELTGEVLSVMKELAMSGMTMLVVSHEMDFAREVANKIVFLEEGKVSEIGTPEKIFLNPEKERTKEFISRITNPAGNIKGCASL